MTIYEIDFNITQGKKRMLKAIFILISANKTIFSKNWDFLFLSPIEKKAITILKMSSFKSLIF